MYETRISDTCLSCITLINTQAAKLALKFNIKMIFAGFTAGQVPKAVVSNQHHFYAESFNNQKEQYKASLGEDYKAFEIEKDRYGFEEIISPQAKEYLDEIEKKAKKKKSDK